MTQGRCVPCNVRYVWGYFPRLRNAYCPKCGSPLCQTSHILDAPAIEQRPLADSEHSTKRVILKARGEI